MEMIVHNFFYDFAEDKDRGKGYMYIATMTICRGKWFIISFLRTFSEYCAHLLVDLEFRLLA